MPESTGSTSSQSRGDDTNQLYEKHEFSEKKHVDTTEEDPIAKNLVRTGNNRKNYRKRNLKRRKRELRPAFTPAELNSSEEDVFEVDDTQPVAVKPVGAADLDCTPSTEYHHRCVQRPNPWYPSHAQRASAEYSRHEGSAADRMDQQSKR